MVLQFDSFGQVADNKDLGLQVPPAVGKMTVAGRLVLVLDSDRKRFLIGGQSERSEVLWEPGLCVTLAESDHDRAG